MGFVSIRYGVVDSFDENPLCFIVGLFIDLVGSDSLVAHLLGVLVEKHVSGQRFRSHAI